MIAEIVLIILFAAFSMRLCCGLSTKLILLLWIILFVHVTVTGAAHYWALQQHPTGVVFDTSVDAQKYYFTAKQLAQQPLWSIKPADITRISGSMWHLGYYYFCIIATKLSPDDSMLLVRTFKVGLYFLALVFTARIWQRLYGVRATLFGVVYLGLGWWEIIYHNFRNYRDGLLVSISLFLFALLLQRFSKNSLYYQVSVKQPFTQLLFILFCLSMLFVLRLYLAIAFVFGILIYLILNRHISFIQRAVFLSLILISIVATQNFVFALEYGMRLFNEQMITTSLGDRIFKIAKVILSPVPWQYSEQFLIPSHFIYLYILVFAVWLLIMKIRPKPWWQITIVAVLVIFMGLMLDTSHARKRMPFVPIIISWSVAGMASKRKQYSCIYKQSGLNKKAAINPEQKTVYLQTRYFLQQRKV